MPVTAKGASRRSLSRRAVADRAEAEWATRVVRTLTDEYLKQRAERYQSPQAVLFFEEQMREAEQRLNENTEALERFADEASLTLVEGSEGSIRVKNRPDFKEESTLFKSIDKAGQDQYVEIYAPADYTTPVDKKNKLQGWEKKIERIFQEKLNPEGEG